MERQLHSVLVEIGPQVDGGSADGIFADSLAKLEGLKEYKDSGAVGLVT